MARLIGIQDDLRDRERGKFYKTSLCASSPSSSLRPNPICREKGEAEREEKRLRDGRGGGVREELLCMQCVGSGVLRGDIVCERETAFYAGGEIFFFRFVLQPFPSHRPHTPFFQGPPSLPHPPHPPPPTFIPNTLKPPQPHLPGLMTCHLSSSLGQEGELAVSVCGGLFVSLC